MNLKALRDHYLRLDARSLGLFRLAIGAVLIGDVVQRLRFAKEFYSNDGVLPNHSHLFNLRETTPVWSLLHAFSSPLEAQTALSLILVAYVLFFIGWRTRVFQIVALMCLWSLGSRNILLENAGNYLAMALLGLTVFLPLGSRFSLDSLRASMDARDEKTPRALNDRALPNPLAVDAARDPGWTPTSIAALAVLVQLAIVYVCLFLQQKGDAWADGNGLYYAMNTERWASSTGAWLRDALPGSLLGVWARGFKLAEIAVPVLLFVPVVWRHARLAAAGLMIFTGLTLAIPFSLGLFGWTLVASAALVIAPGTWEAFEGKPLAKRARTVIYDVDCGVCLWLARLLKRLDLRHNLVFRGNDDLEGLPAEVTPELVGSTLVVTAGAKVETRARAVAAILDALPLGWALGWMVRLPGILQLGNLAYDAFAARRQRVSVAMGKAACGVEAPHDDPESQEQPALVAAPAVRLARGVSGSVREIAALVLFAALVSQATQVNDIGWSKLVPPKWLAGVVAWPRMLERWDVLADVTTEDSAIMVDAQTKGGRTVDPLTGREPEFNPGHMRGMPLGQLWSDYLFRIHQKEWSEFQRPFRDYLNKGGPRWIAEGDDAITGYDVYLLKQAIPAPGQPRAEGLTAREKFITQNRGGKVGADRHLPLLQSTGPKR